MRKRALVIVSSLALAGGVILAACGGGGGGGCDDAVDLTGNWSGTLQDNNCGTGTFGATFSQTHCAVSGIWSADFSVPACDELGSLTGNVDDNSVELRLTPNGSDCRFDVDGLFNGVNQVSGTYTPDGNCEIQGGGTFTLTRANQASPTPANTATPGTTPNPTSTPSPSPTP